MIDCLDRSIAVVTGGGRGIGREIASHLAKAGAAVAVLARTSREIEEAAAEIECEGGRALAVAVDLVDHAAVERAIARVVERLGPVDLLINNHGSFRAFGPIWDCDPAQWWGDVAINLQGTFHTCRTVVPAMLARGRGRIVNLVSGGTGTSFPHGSGYASSKAAIMRFTECLNDTTVGAGVRAFTVDPGLVRTAMTELQLHSDAGRTFLPGIQQLFDEGVAIPPARAAALMVDIAAGRFDALAGRMLCGVDDRDDLARGMDRIVAEDGRTLRVMGLESAIKL